MYEGRGLGKEERETGRGEGKRERVIGCISENDPMRGVLLQSFAASCRRAV